MFLLISCFSIQSFFNVSAAAFNVAANLAQAVSTGGVPSALKAMANGTVVFFGSEVRDSVYAACIAVQSVRKLQRCEQVTTPLNTDTPRLQYQAHLPQAEHVYTYWDGAVLGANGQRAPRKTVRRMFCSSSAT